MKKIFSLALRNIKEMLRDPLSLVFCLVFPVLLLVVMQMIFKNLEYVPDNFAIKNYASGICVFGFAFIMMFVAMQISSDKNTAFMQRLNIAPIGKSTYYLSFVCSALPLAIAQSLLFFIISLIFGFPFDANFVLSIIYLIPSAFMYISLGIMIGVLCKNEKQTGPISSVIITFMGVLGGVFMPLSILNGGLKTFVNILPFSHTVFIASELHTLGAGCIYPHILYILGYTVLFWIIAIAVEKLRHR